MTTTRTTATSHEAERIIRTEFLSRLCHCGGFRNVLQNWTSFPWGQCCSLVRVSRHFWFKFGSGQLPAVSVLFYFNFWLSGNCNVQEKPFATGALAQRGVCILADVSSGRYFSSPFLPFYWFTFSCANFTNLRLQICWLFDFLFFRIPHYMFLFSREHFCCKFHAASWFQWKKDNRWELRQIGCCCPWLWCPDCLGPIHVVKAKESVMRSVQDMPPLIFLGFDDPANCFWSWLRFFFGGGPWKMAAIFCATLRHGQRAEELSNFILNFAVRLIYRRLNGHETANWENCSLCCAPCAVLCTVRASVT